MKKIKTIGLLLLPFILLALFLMFFNPYEIPLVFLSIPFALLTVGLYRGFKVILAKVLRFSPNKARLVAGITTSLILLVILLQSIGQLSVRDFFLLAALLGCMIFYLRRY